MIFLFRGNTLCRLISLLANDYDKDAKQLNGTQKSRVHSKEEVQDFLRVPVRRLISRLVKIHMRPLPDLIKNWEKVSSKLNGTKFAHFLNGLSYVK